MTKKDFIQICSDAKFWQWIRNKSPIPYEKVADKSGFLSALYEEVDDRTYYPSPPKDYLILNKGYGVLRIIPALKLEDLCVYYYCVRRLEKYIALNHTPGTYGGFGMKGRLRHIEEEEIDQIKDAVEIVEFDGEMYAFSEMGEYPVASRFNPKAWFAEWDNFTGKLYFNTPNFKNGFVAELDISNFYDSIQLDNLEFKLRKYVHRRESDVIYLLMHFLRFWNRHVNFYRQQGSGIPQDTFGECSRILANFYLQNYDKNIAKVCRGLDAKYFRYADDQIIFGRSRIDLEMITAKASSLLMREGLNFNQKKVNVMKTKEFKRYYAFQNFIDLVGCAKSPDAPKILKRQIIAFFKTKNKLRKSGTSLLKRILNILGVIKQRPNNFLRLKRYILKREFLLNPFLSSVELKKIYDLINGNEKRTMLHILNSSIKTSLYSNYLYELRRFYLTIKKPIREIKLRIGWVNRFYKLK